MMNKILVVTGLFAIVFAIHSARAVPVNIMQAGSNACEAAQVIFEKEKKDGEKEDEKNPEEECE